MSNNAYADDPDLRIVRSDDPDSQRLIAFLSRWIWPGIGGLTIVSVIVAVLDLAWAYTPVLVLGATWLVVQLVKRPRQFLSSFAGFFGSITGFMAKHVAPLFRKANAALKNEEAPVVQGVMAAPPKRADARRFDWLGAADVLLKLLPLIIILGVAAMLWSPVANLINGPSGREVAAEAEAGNARSEARTGWAEANRGQVSIGIIEDTNRARRQTQAQVEQAREAVDRAADLDAAYAEYRARAQRLRDEGGSAAALAVQQHAAGVDP